MADKITIVSDAIQKAYNGDSIKSIDITSTINCCDTIYSRTFDLLAPTDICSYIGTFSYDSSIPDFKNLVVSLRLSVNGVVMDILDPGKRYNATLELETLKTDVNNWFFNNGYVNTTFEYTLSTVGTLRIVQFKFNNLSNGVVPTTFTMMDESFVCTEEVQFICQNFDNCIKYEVSYLFAGNSRYTFDNFYYLENGAIQTIDFLNTAFVYDTSNPVIPISQIQIVKDLFAAANTGMFLDITVVDNVMTFSVTDFSSAQLPIYTTVSRADEPTKSYFDCTENLMDSPSCSYTLTMDSTAIDCPDFDYISALYVLEDGNVAPTAIDLASTDITDEATITLAINNWIASKSYTGVFTIVNGVYMFDNLPLTVVPHSVQLANTNGDIRQLDFVCTAFDSVPNPSQFDATALTFTSSGITLLPNFYGGEISDGIYNIKITATLDNDDLIKESYCRFVDDTIKCKVAEKVLDNSDVYFLYESIKFGENCNDCDCANMCELYKKLIKELNNGMSTDTPTDFCGC